ncbi:WW domain containing protein [Novymonas esmeraldas]|uniref:WW domain containing protein n=1 Tax=Novymonas esmeraldas TaxID=1808958 RepID=A0AAW0ELC2_9TRYP
MEPASTATATSAREQQSPRGPGAHGPSHRTHKQATPSSAATASAMPTGGARGSPPLLVSSSSTTGPGCCGSSSSTSVAFPSTGCVRWCMNVALQSFTGEPWAVTLQPAAEDDIVLNRSFHSSATDSSAAAAAASAAHTTATTTTASANNSRQHRRRSSSGGGSGSDSPVYGPTAARMSPSMLRSGLQLAVIDYSDPQPQYPGGPVLDATVFGYDPFSEDSAALHQCVSAINSPPVTFGVDDLLSRITNVEFIAEQGTAEDVASGGVPMHYRLASSLEPMLHATLNPAITAVVDHCVSSIVLVYGATQEMKQMGLIGTPEECGLLPHGIRALMERLLERKERQLSKASSGGGSGVGGDDAVSGSDRTDGVHSRPATSHACNFVFPAIGSRRHRFVRMEAAFTAFDSTNVVDLLDLSNKHVELVLKLAPPPTPSAFDDKTEEGTSAANASATTDSFVLNSRAMPVENTNDALSALDVGLENLSRALELSLLQSESGSSLLFSVTAFTDTCRCATMHVLCLAEDPAAQTWLASTVQARSQAIPLGEEQSWASIQNTPMPPPLHHHAATMLVPSLCFGNMFTSVLICVYNSITALSRLNRDLTFALTGYRMRTIPRVTLASSRKGLRKLPPSWEEYFTSDGRRYFIDTSTQTTTWDDPRFTQSHRSSRSGSSNGSRGSGGSSSGSGSGSVGGGSGGSQHRPSRIGLGAGDKDFLASRLQQEMHGTGAAAAQAHKAGASRPDSASAAGAVSEDAVDIGIVVVDTMCRPRVLIDSRSPQFALQYHEQEEVLRAKQRELERTTAEMQRQAEAKAKAAAEAASVARAERETRLVIAPAAVKPGEAARAVAAGEAAPVVEHDLVGILPTFANGLIGLDDVDDEEVSTLCRSNSANIDDFMFEDEDEEEEGEAEAHGEEEEEGGKHAGGIGVGASTVAPATHPAQLIARSTAAGGEDGGAALESSSTSSNAAARFYANALSEQAVGVADMNASCSMPSAAASTGGCADTAPARSCLRRASSASDAPRTTVAAVPPEMQDLESLVDEFTAFYRRTFELQQRVVELEAELKRRKPAKHASSLLSLPAAPSSAEVEQLVLHMQMAVEKSPSAEVHAALTPILAGAAATHSAAATSAVLDAFRAALRLAAQASRV